MTSGAKPEQPSPLTFTVDGSLYEEALSLADSKVEPSALIQEALRTFIRVKVGQQLATLRGSAPRMPAIPRRS